MKGYVVWVYFCTLPMRDINQYLTKKLDEIFDSFFTKYNITPDMYMYDSILEEYYNIFNSD